MCFRRNSFKYFANVSSGCMPGAVAEPCHGSHLKLPSLLSPGLPEQFTWYLWRRHLVSCHLQSSGNIRLSSKPDTVSTSKLHLLSPVFSVLCLSLSFCSFLSSQATVNVSVPSSPIPSLLCICSATNVVSFSHRGEETAWWWATLVFWYTSVGLSTVKWFSLCVWLLYISKKPPCWPRQKNSYIRWLGWGS